MHYRYSILLGVLLIEAVLFVSSGSPQALAAFRPTYAHHVFSSSRYHASIRYDTPENDYRNGYQQGYSDCRNQQPSSQTSWLGYYYTSGYNNGYQYCQSKQFGGAIKGNSDGYNDGYNACKQEHANDNVFSGGTAAFASMAPASPGYTGYSQAYQDSYNSGYNACEAHYGNQGTTVP